jgi:tartrate-resistant acid phosphatase type 5
MTRAATAALLLALAGAAGCCGCATPPTRTVRNGAARDPGPAPALSAPALRALHIGDFGDGSCQQAAVAAGIRGAHGRAPFDLGFAAGDLVYECGPDTTLPGADACAFGPDGNAVAPGFAPPNDPAFTVHDRPLAFLGATPVYAALGNHDVGHSFVCGRATEVERAKACLNVAHRGPQWRMPGRHFAVDVGPARLIVVDSNVIVADYGGFTLDGEVAFVAAQAEGCDERTCFLVAHHPPVTAGAHRADASPPYRDRMARLLAAGRGRIRAYLAGHDHDLQHLRMPGGLDVFVSGASARGRWRSGLRNAVTGAELLFGSARWGFGVLEVSRDGWRYRFEDHLGAPLYCCTAIGAGRCEPAACR